MRRHLEAETDAKLPATRDNAGFDWRVALAVAITILSWGSAFPAIRAAVTAYTPLHVALLRYLIASVVLLGYALLTRMPFPGWRDAPRLALAGGSASACTTSC